MFVMGSFHTASSREALPEITSRLPAFAVRASTRESQGLRKSPSTKMVRAPACGHLEQYPLSAISALAERGGCSTHAKGSPRSRNVFMPGGGTPASFCPLPNYLPPMHTPH